MGRVSSRRLVDLQFYGMATDRALDTRDLARHRPLLRRLDTRTMALHDYATEIAVGRGRMVITTLRLAGGLGDQPLDLQRNTAGTALLVRWLQWLQRSGEPGARPLNPATAG